MYRSDKEKNTHTHVLKASTVLNKVLLMRRNGEWKRGYAEKPIKPQRTTSKAVVNFHQPGVDSSAG